MMLVPEALTDELCRVSQGLGPRVMLTRSVWQNK
jgi:hypothetical protein